MSTRLMTYANVLFLAVCFVMLKHEPLSGARDQHQALTELEQHWLDVENNPSALEPILADDFVHVLPVGFVSKAEQLTYMRRHPSEDRSAKHFEDLRVRIFGSVGIANGIVVATMADGTVRKTIFTDVFAYRNGKWQAVNAQELPFSESTRP